MFIAINAKADIQGSKKGKLTPAQNAQVNAWCLASKTGIFDFGGKCLASSSSFVASNNEATIDFRNGFVAICGRIIECEEGTQVKVVTPTTGTINGKIILRYDLTANGANEFTVTTTNAELVQQDLNENPITGVYEFELYSYTATPTSVTLVRNNTDYIPDIGGKLSQFMSEITPQITNLSTRIDVVEKPLKNYDNSKGTVEERLTRLGFKSGSVTISGVTATQNELKRQGNYVLGNLSFQATSPTSVSGTFPQYFRPKTQTICYGENMRVISGGAAYYIAKMTIETSGKFTIKINDGKGTYNSTVGQGNTNFLNFGFEVAPI